MAYCTQTDLENVLGGAAVLKQLLDKTGDGTADSATVTHCLDSATSEIDALISRGVDIATLDAPYPNALIFKTAQIAAYYAHMSGQEGQNIPPVVKDAFDRALEWANGVGERRITLGSTVRKTSAHLMGEQVRDYDANGFVDTNSPRKKFNGFA